MTQEIPTTQAPDFVLRDANWLDEMAKAQPDACFLKGSGVLKLLDAIRQLEAENRSIKNSPHQQVPPALPAHVDAAYLKQAVAVAITMLYDAHKKDVVRVFDFDSLKEVVCLTDQLRPQQVEDIYKKAWDMLSAQPAPPTLSETPLTQDEFNQWFDALPWHVRAMWPAQLGQEPYAWHLEAEVDDRSGFFFDRSSALEAQSEHGGEIIELVDRATQPPAALREPQAGITWPESKDVGRLGDMSPTAHIRVGLDSDNDVYVSVSSESGSASIEFCTPGAGGGRSSRTRMALIALMVAIEGDNAETPSLDWWARRMGGASKEQSS